MTPGSLPVAFTIADISAGGSGPFPSAGWRETEVDYIASEAKVSVLYAAYALRDMVNRFAATDSALNPADLFSNLHSGMDPSIRRAVARIASASNLSDVHRLPNYAAMFTASPSGGHLQVDFTAGYLKALEDMIVPSDNSAAATSIHGIGYGYLNGCLAAAGLFDDAPTRGCGSLGTSRWAPSGLRSNPSHNDGRLPKRGRLGTSCGWWPRSPPARSLTRPVVLTCPTACTGLQSAPIRPGPRDRAFSSQGASPTTSSG